MPGSFYSASALNAPGPLTHAHVAGHLVILPVAVVCSGCIGWLSVSVGSRFIHACCPVSLAYVLPEWPVALAVCVPRRLSERCSPGFSTTGCSFTLASTHERQFARSSCSRAAGGIALVDWVVCCVLPRGVGARRFRCGAFMKGRVPDQACSRVRRKLYTTSSTYPTSATHGFDNYLEFRSIVLPAVQTDSYMESWTNSSVYITLDARSAP